MPVHPAAVVTLGVLAAVGVAGVAVAVVFIALYINSEKKRRKLERGQGYKPLRTLSSSERSKPLKLDCLIIASYGGTLPPGAVSKRNLNLSLLCGVDEDLKAIQDMIGTDPFKELVSVHPQFGVIRKDVASFKQLIRETMEKTRQKTSSNGLVIWYTGHGDRLTGDWPFRDGSLTFSDIYKLYKRHMRGKYLYIVTDCCYSGNWVKECARHLDKENIYCGHHAEERKIYLKVFASCLPDQEAMDPLYTTGKGVRLLTHGESDVIAFSRHRVLNHNQTTLGFNFTRTKKCKVNGNKCVSSESTWEQDVDELIKAEPNRKYSI